MYDIITMRAAVVVRLTGTSLIRLRCHQISLAMARIPKQKTDDDWVSLVNPHLTQEEREELLSAESDTESEVEDTEAPGEETSSFLALTFLSYRLANQLIRPSRPCKQHYVVWVMHLHICLLRGGSGYFNTLTNS